MYHELELTVRGFGSRQELRHMLVSKFLDEDPGKGRQELASKYRYNVETLRDGKRIYLLRPAHLNKGFDFTVHVENTRFGHARRGIPPDLPTHNDVLDDLRSKKRKGPAKWQKLYQAIQSIYVLKEPDKVIDGLGAIDSDIGHPTDLILKVIKWLFIEQDVTYWNWSGRRMFMSGVDGIAREPK